MKSKLRDESNIKDKIHIYRQDGEWVVVARLDHGGLVWVGREKMRDAICANYRMAIFPDEPWRLADAEWKDSD